MRECKHQNFDWMRIGKAYFINGVKLKECNWCKEDSGCLVDGTLYVPNIYRVVIGLFGPTDDAIRTCVNLAISKVEENIDLNVAKYQMTMVAEYIGRPVIDEIGKRQLEYINAAFNNCYVAE